jgi:DNA polymerase-3 subunit delta
MASPEPLQPAYLIVGSDRPKVRHAVQRLRQRVIRDSGSDLNVHLFEVDPARGAEAVQEILDATSAPSLALGLRLILVLRADKLRAPQRKQLAACLDDPMPDTCIAFEAEKLGKDDALLKSVTKAGTVLRYDLPKKWEMAGWVVGRAKDNRMHMSRRVADHLLARCGSDPSRSEQIERELEKLAVYCHGAEPTEADVDAVCTPDDDTMVFDLLDALGHRDRGRCFALLEALYASGSSRDDANGVLYSLKRRIEQLDAALQLPHADKFTAAKQLGVKPYPAQKLLEQRERFDRRRIGRAYRALAEAEAGLRGRAPVTLESSGGVNDADRLVVELALARMLA